MISETLFTEAPEAVHSAAVLRSRLESLQGRGWRGRQRKMERAGLELGTHFSRGEPGRSAVRWRTDLEPHLIARDEWSLIERGVLQRARAFALLVQDLFGAQKILRDGILPVEMVLEDPAFYRELVGLQSSSKHPFRMGAVDLVRSPIGQWVVVENRFSLPEGLAYVLQNRRLLAEVVPELFEGMAVAAVSPFLSQWMELMKAESGGAESLLVMLSRGRSATAFFDEMFLARQTGLIAARPSDLSAGEDGVFLRTIDGLRRVDGILRRVETSSLDPVSFTQSSFLGTPGIVHALRRERVSMFNAPGAEVADNKALLAYASTIIRYYLRAEPILPTVPTFHSYDPDHVDLMRDEPETLNFRPIHSGEILVNHCGLDESRLGDTDSLRELLRGQPGSVVGQRLRPLQEMAFGEREGVSVSRSALLRVFFTMGSAPTLLPGGLTMALRPGWMGVAEGEQDLLMKDTWVMAGSSRPKGQTRSGGVVLSSPAVPLGSRVAESFYWLGRYLERGRNGAHHMGILEAARWTEFSGSETVRSWNLWRGVAAAGGFDPLSAARRPPPEVLSLTFPFVFDADQAGSVSHSFAMAWRNLEDHPDFISPETWAVMTPFLRDLKQAARRRRRDLGGMVEWCRWIVAEHSRVMGTMERTMVQDDSMEFFRLGTAVERTLGTIILLRVCLPSLLASGRGEHGEDLDLSTCLRVLGCLDAYRREYRARAHPALLLRLIVSGYQTPASIAFNHRAVRGALDKLAGRGGPRESVQRRLQAVESLLHQIAASLVVSPPGGEIGEGEGESALWDKEASQALLSQWKALEAGMTELHAAMDASFFSHLGVLHRLRGAASNARSKGFSESLAKGRPLPSSS